MIQVNVSEKYLSDLIAYFEDFEFPFDVSYDSSAYQRLDDITLWIKAEYAVLTKLQKISDEPITGVLPKELVEKLDTFLVLYS